MLAEIPVGTEEIDALRVAVVTVTALSIAMAEAGLSAALHQPITVGHAILSNTEPGNKHNGKPCVFSFVSDGQCVHRLYNVAIFATSNAHVHSPHLRQLGTVQRCIELNYGVRSFPHSIRWPNVIDLEDGEPGSTWVLIALLH